MKKKAEQPEEEKASGGSKREEICISATPLGRQAGQAQADGGQAGERGPQPCQRYSKLELIRGQRRGQVLFSGKGHTLPQNSPRTLPLSLRGLGLRARPGVAGRLGRADAGGGGGVSHGFPCRQPGALKTLAGP